MFRGIDPSGLSALAAALEERTELVQSRAQRAGLLLAARGFAGASMTATAVGASIAGWGSENAGSMRWRADAISHAQNDKPQFVALLRAEFAVSAVFNSPELEQEYHAWLASRQRVHTAIANIAEWLDQSWIDWDVSNDDLHNIWSTLDALQSNELDQVIAALSSRQLERWIGEMSHRTNGFSRSEKLELFSLVAQNASGESLSRVYTAILNAGSRESAVDLGAAIGHHAADSTIVDFTSAVIARGLLEQVDGGMAIGLVVDGVTDPAAVDTVVETIATAENALEAILVDGVVAAHVEDTGASCVVIDPTAGLLRATVKSGNPEIKAVALLTISGFAGGGGPGLRDLLNRRQGIVDLRAGDLVRSARPQLISGALDLLLSDTEAVVSALATQSDPDGTQTAAFLHEIIDQGRFADLGRIVTSLRGGEVVDPVRFSDRGTVQDYPYPHAQNLAFLAATLNNALNRYATEAKNRIDTIDWLAKLAGLVAGPLARSTSYLSGLAGGAISLVIEDISVEGTITRTKNQIDDGLSQLTRVVESHLRPQLPAKADLTDFGKALLRWLDRYAQLSR